MSPRIPLATIAVAALLAGCCANSARPDSSACIEPVAARDLPPNASGVNVVYGDVPEVDPASKHFTGVLVCGAYPKEILENIRVLSVASGTIEGNKPYRRTVYQLYNAGDSTVKLLLTGYAFTRKGLGDSGGTGSMTLAPHEADLFWRYVDENETARLSVVVQGPDRSSKTTL